MGRGRSPFIIPGAYGLGSREGFVVPGEPQDDLLNLRERTELADGENGPLLDDPGKKNLGRSEIVIAQAVVPTEGRPKEELLVNVKGSDEMATVVSVTLLNPQTFDVMGASADSLPVARVEWGVSGTQAEAFIDFIHGTQFSVPASFLRVYGRFEHGESPDPAAERIKLGAFIGYLAVRPSRLQRTLQRTVIDGIASAVSVPVPPFASDVLILRQGGALAPAFDAEFVRGDGITLYTIVTAAGALMGETHIANGVRTIRITNNGGAPAIFTLVFRLAL